MKIAFDAKRLFRNYTGLGNYSRTLVGNLSRQYPDNDYFLMTEKVITNDETAEFLTADYRVVSPTKCRQTWRGWGMAKDLKKNGVQIYHGLSHDLPFGIARSGVKSVVTVHDVCYKTFPDMFPLVERMIYRIKYRHSLKNADRVIAISESTKSDILKYFDVDPSKIEVIYQALNPVFYERRDESSARRMVAHYGVHGDFALFVGSLNSRKNLLSVLKAYAMITPEKRPMLVVIGNGRGEYAEKCSEAIESLSLTENVIHIRNLNSMSVLADFYTLARFMVYPSFYEGFGLPVAEAMLCGCPAITSSVSSLPEAGGEWARYVDPNSVDEIAQAMISLIDISDKERAYLSESGRDWVYRTLDPEKLTSRVETLYGELAGLL